MSRLSSFYRTGPAVTSAFFNELSDSDVNKDLTFKAKDKDKDQTLKAKDKDKDQTFKAKDQDKD